MTYFAMFERNQEARVHHQVSWLDINWLARLLWLANCGRVEAANFASLSDSALLYYLKAQMKQPNSDGQT